MNRDRDPSTDDQGDASSSDPRIPLPLRTSADTEGEVSALLSKIEANTNVLKIVRIVANSPGIFRPFVLMANGLLNRSRLPAKERELVILHLAAQRGVPYEWAEHVPMSIAAGVSDREREILSTGSLEDLSEFSETEQVALRTARAIADGELTPQQWASATEVLSEGAVTDLLLSVAWWGAFVPIVVEALGLIDPSVDDA